MSAEIDEALKQSNAQLAALTEVVKNRKNYDQKSDQLVAVVKPDNVSSEPAPAYDAKYPYNNSTVTESGHSFELDDTPGAERVNLSHRSGTFFEVHADGSKVDKIVNDLVQIVVKNNEVYIMGNNKHSTQGNLKLYIKGTVKAQVDGDIELEVGGNMHMHVGGTMTAAAESFNFVGNVNVVGDITNTGNIVTQGNIAASKNIQAQLDFVGLQNIQIAGKGTYGGSITAGGDVIGGGVSLDNHVHINGGGVGNSGQPAK